MVHVQCPSCGNDIGDSVYQEFAVDKWISCEICGMELFVKEGDKGSDGYCYVEVQYRFPKL